MTSSGKKEAEPEVYNDAEEVSARRDAALLRALSTPHKKQSDMKKRGPLSPRRGSGEKTDKGDKGE
jgi:hypothetical protein